MSRVARSARVGSRQRVETLSGAKTINAAETGELYLVGAASSVTLPAAKDGAYFKFIFSADVTSASALVITAADTSTALIGHIITIAEGANTNVGGFSLQASGDHHRAVSANAHEVLTIGDGSNAVMAGSWVECFSDGSNWVVCGSILAATDDVTATFSG